MKEMIIILSVLPVGKEVGSVKESIIKTIKPIITVRPAVNIILAGGYIAGIAGILWLKKKEKNVLDIPGTTCYNYYCYY